MFYLHEPVEFAHIGEGSRITFDMGSAKVRCTCPGCGAEVIADADDLYERLVLTEETNLPIARAVPRSCRRNVLQS